MARLGAKLLRFEVLDSTMALARELAEDGEPEGLVVEAERQRAGVGRLGRTWESPKGGLWFSVLLRPSVPVPEAPKLTLMTGVAVARTLRERCGLSARLKWPNDVLVEGKKVSGILTELKARESIDYIILGIGINANFALSALPEEIRSGAATLQDMLNKKVSGPALMRAVLDELEGLYAAFCGGDQASVLSEWKKLSDTLGRKVKVETAAGTVQGIAQDLNAAGGLVVKTEKGPVEVLSGDCLYLR